LIREFEFWYLNIHINQSFLGRTVALHKKPNLIQLCQTSPYEREELFDIHCYIEYATKKLYDWDRLNYAILGNEYKRLHAHFVPRYERDVKKGGHIFKDANPDMNFITDKSFVTPDNLLHEIIHEIREEIRLLI
jgi:diadenosine tetraphosphate (Ap4A) HIT family hydrolase